MFKQALRFKLAATLILFIGAALPALGQSSNANRNNVLFAQQDTVTSFNLVTGAGRQVGTVTGRINGTSIVDFQFVPTSPTTFDCDNKVVITDLDGDQLRFRNVGNGTLILPIDPAVFGLGGPVTGTYEVVAGTGKYAGWVGRKYPSRAVLSNPAGGLGTVYVEVLSNPI